MSRPIERCKLCGLNLEVTARTDSRDVYVLRCRRCGEYRLTEEAFEDIREPSVFLRCSTRQAAERKRPLTLKAENWREFPKNHETTTVQENADKLLFHIARCCPRPGQKARFDADLDYPVIDSKDRGELMFFAQFLAESGFIALEGDSWGLTMRGWQYFSAPSSAIVEGNCFVAMSFSPEHDRIYREGIKPGVLEAGYRPICLKDVLTNDDINFRILAEIRKAELVVADFTGQKGGVYFEAGFGLALGRPVFWTCCERQFKDVHFDTNHFQYIFWNDYATLHQRLAEKIIALKGLGPFARPVARLQP